jgi:hypothetical protein
MYTVVTLAWYIVHTTIPKHAYQPKFFEKSENVQNWDSSIPRFKKVFFKSPKSKQPSLPPLLLVEISDLTTQQQPTSRP